MAREDQRERPHNAEASPSSEYLVVARRYRPKTFDELLGQQHVAQALRNAITSNRVGHAYLFTGARGVGKTSAARIFAKALNCVQGPSATPDNACDICQSIDAGEDVDVLEIDGASNRGIEEIRQLRSNINVRPSRATYKIYIIDEVHMLTSQAFNALLKTLEEPPEHVKFIFCTTDPEKIPITVLSRCQRFDFAPIGSDVILERLRQILAEEGREADEEALALLARRAAGSMRDSQSLLEQLLAFCGPRITVVDLNAMLGVADSSTLNAIVQCLSQRDAAGALTAVDRAIQGGIEAGHLTEQLLACFRDLLLAAVDAPAELAMQVDAVAWPTYVAQSKQLGTETLLAMAQILDQTLVRMRQSTQTRILLELALVRLCALDRLDDLGQLVQQLRHRDTGQPLTLKGPAQALAAPLASTKAAAAPPTAEKKTLERSVKAETPEVSLPAAALSPDNVRGVWQEALQLLEDMTGDFAACANEVAISAPNRLVVSFRATYNLQKESCERPERKSRIENALQQVAGFPVAVEFRVDEVEATTPVPKPIVRSPRQLMREKERHELVSRAVELFGAEIVRLEPGRGQNDSTPA